MNAVIRLSFYQSDYEPETTLEMADLRLTGGVLRNQLEHGLIAHYTDEAWRHSGRNYPSVGVAGGCCLLFGIAREASLISEPIGLFSVTGPILRANGVAVVHYVEHQDMWQGLIRPMWWTAMRIVSAASMVDLVDDGVALLNPWDPLPGGALANLGSPPH